MTKFYERISILPQEIAGQLLDLIRASHVMNPNERLKVRLINLYSLNDYQWFEALVYFLLTGIRNPPIWWTSCSHSFLTTTSLILSSKACFSAISPAMSDLTFSRRRFQTGKLWPCSRVGFISFFLSFMMRMLKLMQFRDEFVLLGPCPLQAFFYSSTLLWDPCFSSAGIIRNTVEKAGIIPCSFSPCSSPLHMVKKKDWGWRPYRDYFCLNMVTLFDRYPLPNIADFTSRIADFC